MPDAVPLPDASLLMPSFVDQPDSVALHKEDSPDAVCNASPACEADFETVEQEIDRLPKDWMRRYMREAMRCGSAAEARAAVGGISASSVAKACDQCPDFARLHKEALEHRHGRVDAAVYRGAVDGDRVPFNTRDGVQWYEKRDTKAAELWMRRHGLLAADQVQHTHTGRVEVVDDARMADVLAGVARLLFRPGTMKQVEGKVVSETDKKA